MSFLRVFKAPFFKTQALHLSAVLTLILLLSTNAARGQNVISVGYGEGAPGDVGVQVIVTAQNEEDIHGYSLGLTYNPEALELTDFSVNGTHVSLLGPEFVAPSIDIDLGVATLGVIINFNEPVGDNTLPSTPQGSAALIIGRLTFNVKDGAEGGSYPLDLVDGVSIPAVFNRYSIAGESVAPTLEDGSFFVRGEHVICLDKKLAFRNGAAQNLQMFAYAQHPAEISGYSLAVLYDCTALDLLDDGERTGPQLENTSVFFEIGQDGVEFVEKDIDDDESMTVRLGMVGIGVKCLEKLTC